MEIEVRLFAMLRERAGSDSLMIQLEDGATVRDALSAVEREPGLGELIARMPVVMAVNREYAAEDSTLSEGDEVALIPPVSGGAETEADTARERDDGMSRFSTGAAYADFMELVGRHVPRPPAYVDLLGARPLHVEPGHMRFEFQATEQLLNPAGVVQGGFITAMLDETMGPAALAALGPGHMVPTLELKVSFLRPVRPGRLVADARVVHRGRSIVFLESSLRDDDEVLLATATATARIVELEAPA